MSSESTPNNRTPSTTWAYRKVKISRAPQAQGARGRQPASMRSRPARNPRDPLSISVSFRGGPECWWEIHARGVVIRRPGHLSLHDVMMELQGGKATKSR